MGSGAKYALAIFAFIVVAFIVGVGMYTATDDPAQDAVDAAQQYCSQNGDADPKCVAMKIKARALYDQAHAQ